MKINHFICGSMDVNCYLVTDEDTGKAFIVDPGGESKRLVNFIRENKIKPEYIFLTHGHGDHIGGIDYLKKAFPDIKIAAHKEEKVLLEDPKLNHSGITCGRLLSIKVDHYLNDGESIKIGNMEPVFLFTPGHTPGGMCIYAENSLFSGDTLFEESIGRTDFPGSSYTAIKKSIHEKLFVLPDNTKVYPGHMGFTTIGFEKEHNPFV